MDFIKKAVSGGDSSKDKQSSGSSGDSDYVDKAFDTVSKKAGYNVDRDTQEKITDSGRETFEKATGKKIPDKISN